MRLFHLARDGDRNAYWHLVKPHTRVVFFTAKSILRNSADAEEVGQETLLKALRNIQRFRGDANLKTWLVRIAINESLMRLRKSRSHLQISLEEPGPRSEFHSRNFPDSREIPSEALERSELEHFMQSAIASLPRKYQEVVVLRHIEGLSHKEISQALGLRPENVKTRLWRARVQMRRVLAPVFARRDSEIGVSGNLRRLQRQW